jgi:hypothetical protein
MLLEHEGNLVDQKEGDALGAALGPVLELVLDGPSQKQGGDESLSRAWYYQQRSQVSATR